MIYLYALLCWIPLVPVAIFNGVLREFTYGKKMPELRAHQVSCLTGLLLLFVATLCIFLLWRPESMADAVRTGAAWLIYTVVFEFLFGHYVAKHSWQRLLADYKLHEGRLWLLVLAGTAALPALCLMVLG